MARVQVQVKKIVVVPDSSLDLFAAGVGARRSARLSLVECRPGEGTWDHNKLMSEEEFCFGT